MSEIKPSFGHLIGFRRWLIDADNRMLVSATSTEVAWQPQVNYARGCKGHSSPGKHCHCGFNAWFDFKDAEKNYRGVIGAIAGAGDIRLHKKGFRSSEAQILALLSFNKISKKDSSLLKEISDRYQVPLFKNKEAFFEFIAPYMLVNENIDYNSIPEKVDAPTKFSRDYFIDLFRKPLLKVFIAFLFLAVVLLAVKTLGSQIETTPDTRASIATLALLQEEFYKENKKYSNQIKELVPKEYLDNFEGINIELDKQAQTYTFQKDIAGTFASQTNSLGIKGSRGELRTFCSADNLLVSTETAFCSSGEWDIADPLIAKEIKKEYGQLLGRIDQSCINYPYFRKVAENKLFQLFKVLENKCFK